MAQYTPQISVFFLHASCWFHPTPYTVEIHALHMRMPSRPCKILCTIISIRRTSFWANFTLLKLQHYQSSSRNNACYWWMYAMKMKWCAGGFPMLFTSHSPCYRWNIRNWKMHSMWCFIAIVACARHWQQILQQAKALRMCTISPVAWLHGQERAIISSTNKITGREYGFW